MATVTKVIRWGETQNQDEPMGVDGVGGTSTGTGLTLTEPQTLVGLRMVVDSSLVRESGCGCKLFALIPPGITTVREFKNHLSTKILKTHIPFYFFNGDYRIPDEEDVRIFSLLSEPCQVFPVPQPKSVLSVSSVSALNGSAITFRSTSTPLPMIRSGRPEMENGHNGTPFTPSFTKRVKFSDSFPLDVSGFSNTERDADADAGNIVSIANGNGINGHVPPEATTTGIKRRKRHRKHKSKKNGNILTEMNDAGENSEEPTSDCSAPGSNKMNGFQHGQGPVPLKRQKNANTPEYDADESEIDLSQVRKRKRKGKNDRKNQATSSPDADADVNVNQSTEETSCVDGSEKKKSPEKSEFLSPNTAFAETGYKRIRTSGSGGHKQISSLPPISKIRIGSGGVSGHEHSCCEDGGGQNCDGIETSGKRKDTPMLPRILKNPCATFELVKKSLTFDEDNLSSTSPPPPNFDEIDMEDEDQPKSNLPKSNNTSHQMNNSPASGGGGVGKEFKELKMIFVPRNCSSASTSTTSHSQRLIEEIQESLNSASKHAVKVDCRSIRVGDYKCSTPSPLGTDVYNVIFSERGIMFTLPHAQIGHKAVACAIPIENILNVEANYKKTLPVIFLTTGPRLAKTLRKMLGMSDDPKDQGYHYGPQDGDDCQKMIVFLPTTINEQAAATINKIFGRTLTEIDSTKANEILCTITREPDPLKKPAVVSETVPCSVANATKTKDEEISQWLMPLGPVASVDLIHTGDIISFKVLELDENYAPDLSSLKVAEILDKNGDMLELSYFNFGDEKSKKQRSGVFEIDDEELGSQELDNPKARNFMELMNPTFVLVKDK